MYPIPAPQNPHEVRRLLEYREILSFKDAFENLKNAKDGFVKCAARPPYKKCCKDICFDRLEFLALLDQLSTKDPESIVNLMPMIFCPVHRGQTVYYHAMFLDWISHSGSGLDAEQLENIVIDLESATNLKERKRSARGINPASIIPNEDWRGYTSTISNSKRDPFSLNSDDIQSSAIPLNSKLQTGFASTVPKTPSPNLTDGSDDEKDFGSQSDPKVDDPSAHIPLKDEEAHENTLITPSYASLELGVAKIEITYRKSLKCISMSPHGWRCQELVQTDRLLQARRLLPTLGYSRESMRNLAKLVLCNFHSVGDLPQYYSEAWLIFRANQLPKEEAMRRFDPSYCDSVKLFGDQKSHQLEPGKTKPASNLRQIQLEKRESFPWYHVKFNPKLSTQNSGVLQKEKFEFNYPAGPSFFKSALSLPSLSKNLPGEFDKPKLYTSKYSFSPETPSLTSTSIFTIPQVSTSKSLPPQVMTPLAVNVNTSLIPKNAANHHFVFSTASAIKSSSTSDLNASPPLSRRIKIAVPPNICSSGHLYVRLPPSSTTVSSDVKNLSSNIAQIKLSDPASSSDSRSSVIAAKDESAPVAKDATSDQAVKPPQTSAQSTFERASDLPKRILQQGIIDGNLVEEIRSSIPRGGYVYIFKSARRNLVRVGRATDITRRKQQIRTECKVEDVEEVDSGPPYCLQHPERVVRLVYLELQNFRTSVICSHLLGSPTAGIEEHRTWFDVPERVALQSVQRWRSFVEMAYTPAGTIKEHWAEKMSALPRPSPSEQTFLEIGLDKRNALSLDIHHRLRHERYQKWIED